jgi:prepilin-type N-terminal cleavage/methylation domain-containing protein
MRLSTNSRTAGRSAFTLLELIVALSISVLLLAALYMALSTQFYHARTGREVLDETAVVRGILAKITADINANLGPVNPFYLNASPGGSGSSSSSSSSSSGQSGSTGSGSSASGSTGSGSSSNSSSSSNTNTNPSVPAYVFNLGVRGDESSVVLMVSKVPRELTPLIGSQANQNLTPDEPVSALRRITYWIIPGKGLARQEKSQVTADDPTTVTAPPEIADPSTYTIIAEQVKEMTVEYCNGLNTWQPTWDGTIPDPATSLPMGPPAAIAFTFKIEMSPASKAVGAVGRKVTIRHVVAIQAANRWVTLQTNQSNTP